MTHFSEKMNLLSVWQWCAAQLAEQMLPKPEDLVSNPAASYFIKKNIIFC